MFKILLEDVLVNSLSEFELRRWTFCKTQVDLVEPWSKVRVLFYSFETGTTTMDLCPWIVQLRWWSGLCVHIILFVTVTRCLASLPNTICIHLHLRLLIHRWAFNSALSLRCVVIWGRLLGRLNLLDQLCDLSDSILAILLSPLLLIIFATSFGPIQCHVVPFGTWCIMLFLCKDFDQLVLPWVKFFWE